MNIIDCTINHFNSIYDRLTPKRFFPLCLGILITLGLIILLIPGIPEGHDLYYHLTRFHALINNLQQGEFPAMIDHEAINNHGYATGLFYPDFFLYPAVLLTFCGFSIVGAYKCLIFCWMLFIAFSAYYCALKLSSSYFAAFASAILYTWSSYLATDIFIRSALGEFLSFAFLPWIILGLYEIIFGNPKKFYFFSLGFLGLLFSHYLSVFMLFFICAVIVMMNFVRFLREPKRIFYLFISPIPTLFIGTVCIVPFLEQLFHAKFIIDDSGDIFRHCMRLSRLFLEIPHTKESPWEPSGIGIILLTAAFQRFRLVSKRTTIEIFRDILLLTGLGCLLLATDMPAWNGYFKFFAILQFPWRFFFPATGFLAFGGGLTLASLTHGNRHHEHYWLWILLLGCGFSWSINTVFCYYSHCSWHSNMRVFTPKERPHEIGSGNYLLQGSLKYDVLLKRGDVVTPEHPLELSLSHPYKHLLKVSFTNNMQDNILEMPKIPYYGYQATLITPNGSKQSLKTGISPNKLLTVMLPGKYSSGDIMVQYHATRLQRLSQIISLLSTCVFLLFLLRQGKAKQEQVEQSEQH